MTTSEKSVFTLQAGKSCKLVVVEEDRSIHAMFEATVKMIMPTGKALISIKDKHGNIVYRIHLMNLPDVFPDHRVSEEVTNAVQFPVKGVLGGSVFPTYKIRLEDLPEPNQGAAEGMERPPGLRED
ncbi:hypothetical protein BaRGS_00038444 [Batillaria attramentaria]|uniref:Uncharacterized protein n=1 Tax=Batillaria attramentaria TaxID=370345 RepID=A0ABD0J693_9CAEN